MMVILHHGKILDGDQEFYRNKYLDDDMEKENQVNLNDETLHDEWDLFARDNLYHRSIWEPYDMHEPDVAH